MNHSIDDTPTGPVGGQTQRLAAAAAHRATGWTTVPDLTATALLVVAPLLPWNVYFGLGIPHSSVTAFTALFAVTLLSLLSLGVTRLGPVRSRPAVAGRLRVVFNVPYLLLVLAFVGFDVFETVRFAGTVHVPGGVGPGAWLGVAGALLSAQPAGTDQADGRFPLVRVLGYASMLGATLSFGFNLYWRVKYALDGSGFGKQNVAVITSAMVYGVVALAAVLVASTWLVRTTKASRLATVALGASALAAGILVWTLPVGRDVDAFRGIAQNTSTAGVGFEGYLAWAAAAATFAPRTFLGHRSAGTTEANAWRAAARNGLLLIAVWCLGSMAMRLTDLAVAVSLNYPFSRYDSLVLAGFDLLTATLAIWLRVNLANDAVSARLVSSLCGLVATLSISRVVLGVALAPRFQETPNATAQNPVYGNDLAQQITSVFDVTLCGLALCILTAAILTGRRRHQGQQRPFTRAAPTRPSAPPTTRARVPRPAPPSAAATTRIPTGAPIADTEHPTTVMPKVGPGPRIFRGDDTATGQIPVPKPRIFRSPPDTK